MIALFALLVLADVGVAEVRPLVPMPQSVEWMPGCYAPTGKVNIITEKCKVPREGYEIDINRNGIVIRHADSSGLYYAKQTLEQLKDEAKWPCVCIKDWPRFSFRSVLLDDARCYYGKEGVKQIIKQMSKVKLNVFHWHFIEPEAWRFVVPGYPKLTASLPRGCAYSREDVREVVEFAKSHAVRVIPEIEMPGHNAVTRYYPELSHQGAVGLCPSHPGTIQLFKTALDEACVTFSDEMIHFGGDEVAYAPWRACSRCQAKMKELGLASEADLQAWFMGVMLDHLKRKGKTPIGWSDMLLTLTDNMHTNAAGYWTGYSVRGGLSKDIVINAWYGDWECAGGCGAVAANLGYKVIQYPSNHCYFDFPQGIEGDPYAYSYKTDTTIVKAYEWDPIADVKPEMRSNVLGVGCANWGEKATDLAALEWKLWPRGFATAEVGWSSPNVKVTGDFEERAAQLAERFRLDGVNVACQGVVDEWNGGRRIMFRYGGNEAWVVSPKHEAAGKPWVWVMEWPAAFPARNGVRSLLAKGFHVVTLRPGRYEGRQFVPAPGLMTDGRLALSRRFQAYCVKRFGLSEKVGLIGMSWGGFYSVRYATAYPECVSRVYLDAPLLDFTTLNSYATDEGRIARDYGVDYKTYVGRTDPRQPVNRAEILAKSGIPVLLIYGESDTVVPADQNCVPFAERFVKAGGVLHKVCRWGWGHHPHGLEESRQDQIVKFFTCD